MERIRRKDLDVLVDRINMVTGSPMASYTKTDKMPYKANIGNYYIEGAYGGVKLVRIVSDGGGIENISTGGFGTKRELYNWMQAFLEGLSS